MWGKNNLLCLKITLNLSGVFFFPQLFEYNDTQDVANLKKLKSDTSWNIYELDKIDWHDFDEKDVEENKIIFTLDKESQGLSFLKNGSLSMEVSPI